MKKTTERKPDAEFLALREDYLRQADKVKVRHFSGGGGLEVVAANTSLMDRLVVSVFDAACAKAGVEPGNSGWSLIAVGGYGRGELNPHSDVDLMFLCAERSRGGGLDDLPSAALHMLWDLGLDLGYSVRGIDECVSLAAGDYTIMTALLEARRLGGAAGFLDELGERLSRNRKPKLVEGYIRRKLSERTARRKKHGDSVYLREPNIKEGAGGLRDIHTALWISRFKYGAGSLEDLVGKGLLTNTELKRVKGSKDYLLRLRNELHYVSGHRQDVLTYELQETAAGDFGYRHRAGRMAVENFMRAYYLRARGVHDITQRVIESAIDRAASKRWFFMPPTRKTLDGDFYVMGRALCMTGESASSVSERPELVMAAFAHYQARGVQFSDNLTRALADSVRLVRGWAREPGKAARLFLEILGRAERLYDTLDLMHRMKLLGRMLPEFGAVSALVQHDMYHRYTVDEHSLLALKKLQGLEGPGGTAFMEFREAFMRVKDMPVLTLALLMHDTGKAKGGGHSEKGAGLALEAASRLGMGSERAALVEFLVRNHLLMAHVSQRRELSDTAVLEKFCRIVGSRENLDMLFLMTYADMSAVGPEVFNQWRRALLRELHGRASAYLEDKDSVVAYEKKSIDALSVEFVDLAVREDICTRAQAGKFLANFPPRYLLSVAPDTAAGHLRMSFGARPDDVEMHYEHSEAGFTDLTMMFYDEPGLFYLAAGALSARNMNILNANIFTGRDGLVIVMFQVTDCNKRLCTDDARWSEISGATYNALTGRQSIDVLLPSCPRYPRRTSLTRTPPRVLVDNEVSDRFTVVEVYAHDRVGLLYDITRTLYDQGCYVSSAKVDTDVDRVVDVFYITDIFRLKITDPDRIGALKDSVAGAAAYREK